MLKNLIEDKVFDSHCSNSLRINGDVYGCSMSKTTSGGGSALGGATGMSRWLSTSALLCENVSLNFNVYS